MSRYIPNTDSDRQEMLKDIGLSSINDLFAQIPESVKLNRKLNLPDAMSEMELLTHVGKLAGKNANTEEYSCFLGAGAYDHFIPSVIKSLTSRQEFYTAYTPYQPEISQGTLQAIFEYQTMICELTGMEVANASVYDGATAIAEAAFMAGSATKRNEVLVASNIHPENLEVLTTYARFKGMNIRKLDHKDGKIDISEIEAKISKDTAAVIIQTPNFFGIIEDLNGVAEVVHKNKALLILSCDPISLALLKSPGEYGADIVVGDGQSLGNSLSFGGPYLGFFATSKELMRKMPGRVVGETVDKNGNRGFVLTLQTREQHIRREKATSNICSNQALNALCATIYLSTLGKVGLRQIANLCTQKAHYAYNQLIKSGAFLPVFDAPFFKEFTVKYNGDVKDLNKKLLGEKIIGGYDVGTSFIDMENIWLVAVTEKRTREEIDNLVYKAVSL